jgi:hypothetical protein
MEQGGIVSSEMLTVKVLRLLRPTSDGLRGKLDQLASAICLSLQRLGYEVGEPQISRGQSTARITVRFENDIETFNLLFQGEKIKLVERHVMNYIREYKPEPFDKKLLDYFLTGLSRNSGPIPVLEVGWWVSWRRLFRPTFYPSKDRPIAVFFDRLVGWTSGPFSSMCRVAVASQEITCLEFLDLLRTVIPPGPRRFKYSEQEVAANEPRWRLKY